jgi:hypothetical protein
MTTIHVRIWGSPIATPDAILRIAANATLFEPQLQYGSTNEFRSRSHQMIELVAKVEGVALHPGKCAKKDKSDDHMNFNATATNLCAINSQIDRVSCLRTKRITKMITGMTTTMVMVCGFVSSEIGTILCVTKKNVEAYRNGLINLAFLRFIFCEGSWSKTLPLGRINRQFHPV